jgi:hypothetical protein
MALEATMLKRIFGLQFRARYGGALVVAGIAFLVLVVLDRGVHVVDVATLTLNDSTNRVAIFGAMISTCGLFLTVLLAVLAVVTSMGDERAVIKRMKEDMGNYDELVHRLVGPVFLVMLVAVASFICIMIPGVDTPKSATGATSAVDRGWLIVLPVVTLGLGLGIFFQTAVIARLLGKVLLFKPRVPGRSDTPQAAAQRLESRREAVRIERPATETSESIVLGPSVA